MGMIKKIKQFFCFHDYQLISNHYYYNVGCICKEYYRCNKCGKLMCVRWTNDD